MTNLKIFKLLNESISKQEIPVAMAGLRNMHGICPPEVLKFLLDLFKYNDNSKNSFSDIYYRSALVKHKQNKKKRFYSIGVFLIKLKRQF